MTDKNSSFRAKSALIALVAGLLAACSSETPETVLKREIGEMHDAIERKDPGAFLRYVTDDFKGERGSFDKRSLRGVLAAQLMGHDKIAVTLGVPDIAITGDRATVKVSALVVGGKWLPTDGQTLEIESGWKREGGEWRCYVATWSEPQ